MHSIQLRRERFVEELESYREQAEEFTTCGELTDLNKYLKKAQNLNAKLESAVGKVHQSAIVEKWRTGAKNIIVSHKTRF